MKWKSWLASGLLLLGSLVAGATEGNNPGEPKSRKNEIAGNVINADNKKPLGSVSVTAILTSKKEKVVLTDNQGTYAFDELKPGVYKFIFEKDGYKKIVKDRVVIKTDEAFQMNIEMIEQDEFNFMPGPFNFSDFE
ncbi:MAG TPA: carboxypeptidase-like regulatory domain-containing protein [Chitinophagaceae bacterium]|jgi:hypothetical protein|nr:carboxypeptidase-like regulatory domain-containing protein [Chitinophagaceae bacterium]